MTTNEQLYRILNILNEKYSTRSSNILEQLSEQLTSKTLPQATFKNVLKSCDCCSNVESLLTQLLTQSRPLSALEKLLATSTIPPQFKNQLNKLTIEELKQVNELLNEYIYGTKESITSEQIIFGIDCFTHCFNKSMTHEIMHQYLMMLLSFVSHDINRNKALADSFCLFMNLEPIQSGSQPKTSDPSSLETALKNNPQVIDLIATLVAKSIGVTDTKSKEDTLSRLVQGLSAFTSPSDVNMISTIMQSFMKPTSDSQQSTEKMADSVLDEFIKTDSQPASN